MARWRAFTVLSDPKNTGDTVYKKPLLGNRIDRVFDPSGNGQPACGDKKTFVKPLIVGVAGIECDGKPHVLLVLRGVGIGALP
jgi:hypothetical protein